METTAPQLDPKIANALGSLLLEAKNALARGDADVAAHACMQIWQRLPEPKFQWDLTYMFLHGMVRYLRPARRHYEDLTTILKEYIASKYYLPDDYGPYFWLGTLAFESGDASTAYDYFSKADKLTRGRCFSDEDPRYKKFYREMRAERKSRSKLS